MRSNFDENTDLTLLDLAAKGVSRAVQARVLGYTPKAIRNRLNYLRKRGIQNIQYREDLPAPANGKKHTWATIQKKSYKKPEPEKVFKADKRKCLKCGNTFNSEWIGHRICQNCKSTRSYRAGDG